MKAIALAVALLAPAQFHPPDPSAPIPLGSSICNPAETHCLVNYADWADWQKLADENKELRQMVKTVKCASVTVTEPSRASTILR